MTIYIYIYEVRDQTGYIFTVGLSKKLLFLAKNGKSVKETGASRMFQRNSSFRPL